MDATCEPTFYQETCSTSTVISFACTALLENKKKTTTECYKLISFYFIAFALLYGLHWNEVFLRRRSQLIEL